MKLYHGTTTKINGEYLKTHKAFERIEYGEWVHFANNYDIALLYSVNPIRAFYQGKVDPIEIPAFSSHLAFSNKANIPHKIYEIYPNMLTELFNTTAFIYVCEVDEKDIANPHNSSFERIVPKDVKIEKEIVIPNVLNELIKLDKEGNIKIIYNSNFNEQNDYYCSEHLEIKASFATTQWEADFYYEKFSNKHNILNKIPDHLKHK